MPFDQAVADGGKLLETGATVRYEWTCGGCGARPSFSEPNVIYESGRCACGHVTDLRAAGVGYTAYTGTEPSTEKRKFGMARIRDFQRESEQ